MLCYDLRPESLLRPPHLACSVEANWEAQGGGTEVQIRWTLKKFQTPLLILRNNIDQEFHLLPGGVILEDFMCL